MEEMRDGMMDGSKDGWKLVRGTLVPAAGPGWLSPGTS